MHVLLFILDLSVCDTELSSIFNPQSSIISFHIAREQQVTQA
jgi:hypothetical protein